VRHCCLEPLHPFFTTLLTLCSVVATSVANFSFSSFASLSTSIAFLVEAFTSTSATVVVALASTFSLASANFLFFSTMSSFLFWIFSFFLLFLSVVGSSSSTDSKCVDVVVVVACVVTSSSSLFWDSSRDFSSSSILPIGFTFLLEITSSYFLAPH
jgi:hypothetical protein